MDVLKLWEGVQMKLQNSEEIFNDLLEKIIDLVLLPGQKLSENKTGEEYGVSRTVVRSAFLRLQQLGFLEVLPQSGTFVTKIDFHYIKSALLLRIGVEKEILSRIMRENEDKDTLIKRLEEIYSRQKEFSDKDDYIKEFAALDVEFHKAIMNGYKNHNMINLVHYHLLHISRWRNLTVLNGVTIGMILKEHRRIINCLIDDDIEGLVDVLNKHIDKTIYGAYRWDDKFRYYFK